MTTLYTTYCPQCEVLKTKLDAKNIKYQIVDDIKIMREKGFLSAPILQVEDEIFTFAAAVKWVNGLGE